MSMHLKPLTAEEEVGLREHGLPVGAPSQLADAFRLGMAWAEKVRAEAVLAAPQPDADGWIPWAGGECPLSEGTEFFVRLRDLEEYGDDRPEDWRWSHSDPSSHEYRDDIIAYRIARK